MTTSSRPPAEAVDIVVSAMSSRAEAPWLTKVMSGTFAGGAIGMGFVFYVTTQVGLGDFPAGIAKLIGGLVFSGGLFVVVLTGADLFTSTTMSVVAWADRKLRMGKLLLHWLQIYLLNMVGAGILVGLIFFSGAWKQHDGGWGAVVVSSAVAKVSHSWVEAFFLGILCNIPVCVGAWLTYLGKTVTDRFFAVLLPIALFVATGFEHSVANMFVIPLGILLKGESLVVDGLSVDLTALTWDAFALANLVPVTLGNIVGGSVFVGLTMWAWHRAGRRERLGAE